MPTTTTATALPVTGTVSMTSQDGVVLVLTERLDGHDTFLTGRLELDQETSLVVRILSLDDVTVLHVPGDQPMPPAGETWAGVLHLPHGWRTTSAPADLVEATARAERDLSALDPAELRYALTFLAESTTDQIWRGRIRVIIDALPHLNPSVP